MRALRKAAIAVMFSFFAARLARDRAVGFTAELGDWRDI